MDVLWCWSFDCSKSSWPMFLVSNLSRTHCDWCIKYLFLVSFFILACFVSYFLDGHDHQVSFSLSQFFMRSAFLSLSAVFDCRGSHCTRCCFCTNTHTHSQDGDTALILSAKNGYVDCVRLLLDAGADKNSTNQAWRRFQHWIIFNDLFQVHPAVKDVFDDFTLFVAVFLVLSIVFCVSIEWLITRSGESVNYQHLLASASFFLFAHVCFHCL